MLRVMVLSLLAMGSLWTAAASGAGFPALEHQFREMPMEARRLTGPLFWLHGDDNETPERLDYYLDIVAKGQNGAFCAESRPHSDWLGPRWFHDLDVCLNAAKRLDLKMWIFDDAWWPSQTMGNKVPEQYGAKRLQAATVTVEGPKRFEADGYGGPQFIAAVAGKLTPGGYQGDSLIDLTPFIKEGFLAWDVPAGTWSIIAFSWNLAPVAAQNRQRTVDGLSQDCVDWFLDSVYQPHYDRYKEDFGKTIVGFFYDEPETQGDWGTELPKLLEERGIDWKQAYVAWTLGLSGEAHIAAKYAYYDAWFEAWGRTMYGSTLRWCEERGVASIGHFIEHDQWYLKPGHGAGNLFQMQKYSSMGGMDLVCQQLYPGQRKPGIYQIPKLTSSISHVYQKSEDLAMCEIFGAYGQHLTYPEMKWLADHHQVRGINFMITHSFNPKAPNDTDCPPYFFNDGHEPRWPLYRVWADYTSRLSLLLTGGRHICPVAFLFCGNSVHVGKAIFPEHMTAALQDAFYDCDWLPYDVFEEDAALVAKEIKLHDERYRALIVPPVEAIPYETLRKAKDFFDQGGTVIGYGFLPTLPVTFGKTSADITALTRAIWGDSPAASLKPCRTNGAGGKSFFLAEEPTSADIHEVLGVHAEIAPTLEVLEGDTGGWLHVLHRVKRERDVFLVCNQDHTGEAKRFRLRAQAKGSPEVWDAMRNEITAIPFDRVTPQQVEFTLDLEPMESVLIVFQRDALDRPARLQPGMAEIRPAIALEREGVPAPVESAGDLSLDECAWVWYPEGDPVTSIRPGTWYFRGEVAVPDSAAVSRAVFMLTADNAFRLFVNGQEAGASPETGEAWRTPVTVDLAAGLKPGRNVFAIAAANTSDAPNPAGLIGRYTIALETGEVLAGSIDGSWKVSEQELTGWTGAAFDDSAWIAAKVIAAYGDAPWSSVGTSPIAPADPFAGRCTVPSGVDTAKERVFLEMSGVREGVHVVMNGAYAGGAIGGPFRLDVTALARAGANSVEIQPYAPESVSLKFYPRGE